MSNLWSNPLFGVFLTFFCFTIGTIINRLVKSPIANPLLIGIILCYGILRIFKISITDYMIGGDFVSMFLLPSTAVLGLSIYRQRKILEKEFWPVCIGCIVGSLVSVGTTVLLCRVCLLDEAMVSSLIPKSVTTAIALDVSKNLGGVDVVTIFAVILCGTAGAVFHPILIKYLKLKNEVAQGVAIGTSSHAAGTTSAIKLGEVQGAISGVSIGIAGISTVIIALFM